MSSSNQGKDEELSSSNDPENRPIDCAEHKLSSSTSDETLADSLSKSIAGLSERLPDKPSIESSRDICADASENMSIDELEHIEDAVFQQLDADKLIQAYGDWGLYQMIAFVMAQLIYFAYSSSIYALTYSSTVPALSCFFNGNESVNLVKIDEEYTCIINDKRFLNMTGQTCTNSNGFTFVEHEAQPVSSLLTEFNLTCGSLVLKELGTAIFTVAAMLAVPYTSMLADTYGRRPVLLWSLFIAALSNIAVPYAPWYWSFLLCRFVNGAAADTYHTVTSVVTSEYISAKARSLITITYGLAWSGGMFWVAYSTYFVHDWRTYYLITTAPSIIFCLYYFFIPESPHYLIQKNNIEGIKAYIRMANKINCTKIDVRKCVVLEERTESVYESYGEICKTWLIVKYIIFNGFITFTLSLIYYAISFMSADIGEGVQAYVNSAAVEIPGGILAYPLQIFFGRRLIIIVSLVLQGGAVGVAGYFPMESVLTQGLMLFAKFMTNITYGVHPVFINELFPTSVRSQSYSAINVPQSIGIVISPYLRHLNKTIVMSTICALCFISGILTYFMRETKNQPLYPDIDSLKAVVYGNTTSVEDKGENGNKPKRHKKKTRSKLYADIFL